MASNCKAFRTEIEDAGSGSEPSLGARAHAQSCPACLVFFKEQDSLRRLVGELERVEAPGDFEFRLRARMASARGEGSRRPFAVLRFSPGLASVALAALFALSVAGAFYLRREPAGSQAAFVQPASPALAVPASEQVNPGVAIPIDVAGAATEVKEVIKAEGERLTPKPLPRRNAPPRVRVEAEPDRAQTKGELEFSGQASPIYKVPNVTLKVSAEPLRVVLRDESGSARRLSMKPVSFGSQNLVGRSRQLPNTPLADDGGVW